MVGLHVSLSQMQYGHLFWISSQIAVIARLTFPEQWPLTGFRPANHRPHFKFAIQRGLVLWSVMLFPLIGETEYIKNGSHPLSHYEASDMTLVCAIYGSWRKWIKESLTSVALMTWAVDKQTDCEWKGPMSISPGDIWCLLIDKLKHVTVTSEWNPQCSYYITYAANFQVSL